MLTIGITGGTGSGKTTILNQIKEKFNEKNIGFISQDSYYSLILNRLPIVYAMYVFLNALADVKRCTDGMQGWAVGDFSNITPSIDTIASSNSFGSISSSWSGLGNFAKTDLGKLVADSSGKIVDIAKQVVD